MRLFPLKYFFYNIIQDATELHVQEFNGIMRTMNAMEWDGFSKSIILKTKRKMKTLLFFHEESPRARLYVLFGRTLYN